MRKRLVVLVASLLVASSGTALAAPCVLDKNVGVSEDDARAVEEIVCTEAKSTYPETAVHVRVVRLGSKIVLTLAPENGAEKQLVLSSVEEVPVAAPRLVAAAAEQKPAVETQDVTNVVGLETRSYKRKAGEIHGWLGAIGAGTIGGDGVPTGAGAHAGLGVGSETWTFLADIRATGGGLSVASISGGVRHHLGLGDAAPFLGAGTSFLHVAPKDEGSAEGLGFYAEVGVDVLRTSRVGGVIALRLDLPAFAIERTTEHRPNGYWGPTFVTKDSGYVPVLMTGFSMRF